MKKLLALALCLGLLLSLLPAFAAGITPIMQVVKCNEYVSLREKPDTKSNRIYKVHLGELVTNCSADENGFVRCEWNGRTGYILYEYLQMTDYKYS
ncbi:MAG: SH3 domain-containing protein, partial [Clostridia bacterium]|nr:SH3 domain-containing protein [Clostridia bacterium]